MEEDENKKEGRWRYAAIVALMLVITAVFGVRLADWQIVNGSSFLEEAEKTSLYKVPMDTARGEIVDSKGNGLAVNRVGYAVVFDKIHLTPETENTTILRLISLLESRKEKWADELPITLDSAGRYQFVSGRDRDIKALKAKDFLDVNPYATAEQCMNLLAERYEIKGYSAKDTRNIVSVRYNMTKSGFSISSPYTFASDVSRETVAIVSENSASLPGAQIKITTVRQYPDGFLMPQIIGTIGSISQEEYDKLKDKGYAFNDTLGKSGLEQAFEDKLRGTAGEKVVETTAKGAVEYENVIKAPEPGNTLHLTIDSNLQKVVNASLAENVKGTAAYGRKLCAQNYKGKSKFHGEDCVAGSAVVLRLKDFAVLAASTYPSYDLNEYLHDTNYYTTLMKDKTKPLINRAFNGVFTPGSVVKPYVALAALQEGTINTSTRILANSKYMRFADVHFTPGSIGNYGMVTLNKAIEKSSNSFFYELGYRLGITNMNLYAPHFGLGVKTGIELSESTGTLAGPAEKAVSGGSWWDGNTVEAAVGQDDNRFTPLQLATYVATVANNGVRLKPHLVDKITDYTRKKTVYSAKPTEVDNIGVSQKHIDYVKNAMRSVAKSGTASSAFSNYGVAIGAKTGTAELDAAGSDNVTFVGFAPFDNPQIAVSVVLEHGATSKYSLAVAKDIFDAYFYGKTVDANGNLVMPSNSGNGASSPASSQSPSSAG